MSPARQPWDEAVGRTAVYRARYEPAPVPDGAYVSWALGPIPAHPAHRAAYQAAGTALLRAEQAAWPSAAPPSWRRAGAAPGAAMAPPSEQHRRKASLVHRQAQAGVAAAEARETDAARAVAAAANPLLRKLSPKRLHEPPRPSTPRPPPPWPEHRPTSAAPRNAWPRSIPTRLPRPASQSSNGSLASTGPSPKRSATLASPAPYLSSALGPRPSDSEQRRRWNEAARQIETWRHGELGLGPADGALADDGISAALGPPPTDPADALRRELAVKQLPIEFQPHRTIDRAIEGPALTLD